MKIAITSLYLPSASKIGVGYQVHYLANALVQAAATTVYGFFPGHPTGRRLYIMWSLGPLRQAPPPHLWLCLESPSCRFHSL